MTQRANDQRIPNDQCRIFFNNTRLRWRVTRAAQPPPAWFSSTRDLVLGANWSLGILVIHWSLRHWSLVICSEREPTGNVEEPRLQAGSTAIQQVGNLRYVPTGGRCQQPCIFSNAARNF